MIKQILILLFIIFSIEGFSQQKVEGFFINLQNDTIHVKIIPRLLVPQDFVPIILIHPAQVVPPQ